MINRLKNYIKKESKWNLLSNALFTLLIILLLIPSTRIEILPRIQRLLLMAPSPLPSQEQIQLTETDYEWQYKNEKGVPVRLSTHKEKVIFMNYWATWCPPCIAELPSMNNLYNLYKDQIDFIFLTNEENAPSNLFLSEKGYQIKSGQIIYKQPKILSSNSIPTTFIINKKGKIILQKTGTAKWDSDDVKQLLDSLLRE